MIGVGVGLKDPGHRQPFGLDMGDDCICRGEAGPARRVVKVPHAVDDRRMPRHRIADNIGDGKGRLVEEGRDLRFPKRSAPNRVNLSGGIGEGSGCYVGVSLGSARPRAGQ